MNIDIFPKVVITGDYFCNREKERGELGSYILKGRHTWLQAHRRHGKTSLVAQTVEDLKKSQPIFYSRVFLSFSIDEAACIRKIIKSIDSIIYDFFRHHEPEQQLGEKIVRFGSLLSEVFRKIQPSISLQNNRPVISTSKTYDIVALEESLAGLNALAAKFNYRAVLFIDEFQEIAKLKEHLILESTLREQVEDATHLTFIFAGSEKTLMQQTFTNKKRPLYKHLQPFEVKRISAKCYHSHLNNLAQERWQTVIAKDPLERILFFTQRHPYYVNFLCDELWKSDSTPSIDDVDAAWDTVVYKAKREGAYEDKELTLNEMRVITGIAQGFTKNMTRKDVVRSLNMAASSIQATLKALIDKDFIDENEDGFYVIDPGLATFALRQVG